ncbi:MAG: ATP-binding cassette domain-containing protein [Propionibacteriaceae bacterium]|jgi:energy-coupling factor transport system ATP-binding protein|nr:ATP-binding cassette domain-containing protein [Propionibacteriaceae bacterium]
MIEFQQVTIRYPDAPAPAIQDVNFKIAEGEFALLAGPTGSGKSTLLGAVNSLVPRFTGGIMSGRVTVAGLDTRDHVPRELAHIVGRVGQDPLAGFVIDTVERELAYSMEQLAFPPAKMRTRVEETLDLLSIAELRDRPLLSLSGGQQQRVAIGSVLTAGARVLVLDEPTSALDPTSAEEVLAALLRLVHDLGVTVLIAEHRLERVLEYADRLLLIDRDGQVASGAPSELISRSPVAPPVVQLGDALGWEPIPVSVRDARRLAPALRESLAQVAYPPSSAPTGEGLVASGIEVDYGELRAVREVDVEFPAGQVTVLLGRNGSGKSSLLWALTGAGKLDAGRFSIHGEVLSSASLKQIRGHLRMVPQTAADLLYLDSVAAECHQADTAAAVGSGTCRALLDALAPGIGDEQNPRDLSEGQRLALALAVQLSSDPQVLLLDEPTRGLDYQGKAALVAHLRGLALAGCAICVATHDVEFAALVADRAVVMAGGEVIAAGSAREVLGSSAIFSPQVARVLAPLEWLSVTEVLTALGGPDA